MRAFIHRGWAHCQRVRTFLTRRNSQFFSCDPDAGGVRTYDLWTLNPMLYQLSHPITPTTVINQAIVFSSHCWKGRGAFLNQLQFSSFLNIVFSVSVSTPTTPSIAFRTVPFFFKATAPFSQVAHTSQCTSNTVKMHCCVEISFFNFCVCYTNTLERFVDYNLYHII